MSDQLRKQKEWVEDRGVLFQLETEPGEGLLYVIRHKLAELGSSAAHTTYGSSTLRIFQSTPDAVPMYEDWQKLNSSEYVYVNRYDPKRAFWWLEKWERPQERIVPDVLRGRVNMQWRLEPSRYADERHESAWPEVTAMLGHVANLNWKPDDSTPFLEKTKG